jgi:hypothetical protein
MATYPRWRELGRHVRRGEKAITLCRPVTVKRVSDSDDSDDVEVFARFMYQPHWFVLAQTEGADVQPVPIPTWDAERALVALDITEVTFDETDGNVLGFARTRSIAINPANPMPHKTRFHEMARVLLGHTPVGVAIRASERTDKQATANLILDAAVDCSAHFERSRDERPTRTIADFDTSSGGVTN